MVLICISLMISEMELSFSLLSGHLYIFFGEYASPLRIFELNCLTFLYLVTPQALGTLVPKSGIQSRPPAMEVWSPNYWTTRKVPGCFLVVEL